MPPNPLGGGGGGAPPAGGGGLSTILGALQNKTSNPGQDLSKQMGDLQGADPSMILRQLESVNQVLGVLFVKSFQTLPNVANQISTTMKALSRALKEAQQASQVGETVGKTEAAAGGPGAPPPINFSAASGGETQPGPGAGS
jgi:hypothetical protein